MRDSRLRQVLMPLLFVVSGLIFYATILNGFFASDDFNLLYHAIAYGPFGAWSKPISQFLRPLISVSFYTDYQLWHLNATGFHLTNVVLHSLGAYGLFQAVDLFIHYFDLDKLKERGIALCAGLLFLAMPAHSEAVSWISGRTDVIATFFLMLSLWVYLRFRVRGGVPVLITSVALFVLALLAKESPLTYPALIGLIEMCHWLSRPERSLKGLVRHVAPTLAFLAVLPFYAALRYYVVGELIGGYGSRHLEIRTGTLFGGMALSFVRGFIPTQYWLTGLNAEQLGDLAGVMALSTLIVGSAFVIWRQRQTIWLIIFGLGGFAITLLPVLALIDTPLIDHPTEGERFIYLPSAFAALFVALIIGQMARSRQIVAVLSGAAILFLAVTLYGVNANWATASRVVKNIMDDIAKSPPHESFVVVAAPDSIHDAYILRNGTAAAIWILMPGAKTPPEPIALYTITDEKEGLSILKSAEHIYYFQTIQPDTYIYSQTQALVPDKELSNGQYTLFGFTGHALGIRFDDHQLPAVWLTTTGVEHLQP